jgi:hypothetical protein
LQLKRKALSLSLPVSRSFFSAGEDRVAADEKGRQMHGDFVEHNDQWEQIYGQA